MGRKLLISILSIMVVYSAYYFGIPAFVNHSRNSEFIERIASQKYGYKVSVVNPNLKMGILPSVTLNADNFSLLNDDGTKAFSMKNPDFKLMLLPLIFKKIDIQKFSSSEIQANFVYAENKITLGQYDINLPEKQNFGIKHVSFDLGKYRINLDDKSQSKNISVNGNYLVVKDFVPDKHFYLSTDGQFLAGDKKSPFKTDIDFKLPINNNAKVNAHISNLDLSEFSNYASFFSENQINSLSGNINFVAATDDFGRINSNLSINDLGIHYADEAASIISKDKIVVKSMLSPLQNGIDIHNCELLANGIKAFLSGKINKLNAKIPNLDIKITIDKSRAEKILALLPGISDLDPDIDLYLLKKTGFWGNVAGNLEIQGKADYPNVYGNIIVDDAYMVKPIPNAAKAIIKLAFKGDKFDLNLKVPTSPTQTVYVKGPINLDKERTADLTITSTNKVDLKTAQTVLNPLHDILHFELGPVPIMDIKGEGGINLHVIGTKKNPYGWGQFNFNNATVSFLDINNMVLKNGSGTLDFDNQNTIFKTKTATLNGQPITVSGTCSLLGNLDFDVKTSNQNLSDLIKIIKTSPMLTDIQKLTDNIESASGPVNLFLKLTGQIKDPKDIVFNKNLFAKGKIDLLSNSIKLKGLPLSISKTTGNINFENLNAELKLQSNLNNSKINIEGQIKDILCNIKVWSKQFNLADGADMLPSNIPYKSDLATIFTNFEAKYSGKIDNIDYNKIVLKGKIYSNKNSKSEIIINNDSPFELASSTFKLPALSGSFKGSPYNISLNIAKSFSKDRILNGNCTVNSLNLNIINDEVLHNILPNKVYEQLNNIEFVDGKINLNARARNNNLNVYSILDGINFLYKPQNLKISIKSGDVLLKNNRLNLNKINAQVENMPVFIDGKILNPQSKHPNADIYLNIKPTQEFFDKTFNSNAVYPIKLKGDTNLSSKILGDLTNIHSKSTLNINENSSLYYMGATIGDIENPVKITLDSILAPNKIKINNLQYDKIITSQNNKPFVKTQLNASGTLNVTNISNIGFNNFKIKTLNPTDAKIFNIIFTKPFMKQGVFTSDLILNGTALNPKIKGKLDITSIDIPFFDANVRDINLDFQNNKIFITTKGTVLTNDILLDAVMKNKLTPPYIIDKLNLKLADLNVNKITDTLRDFEAESINKPTINTNSEIVFNPADLIINQANIKADKIQVRNINANNFDANLTLDTKKVLNVKNFKLSLAEGIVSGNLNYNLANNNANLEIHLDKANALIMSEALFDLKGQIYGLVNGDFNLACSAKSNDECFKTLNGEGEFIVSNGKMPKLGSLEYLLKAGNLIKGGFTGLSINSLIDLITPLKTGEFDSISGDIHIKNGVADAINIFSSGNDLNMYMTGNYNLLSSIADMNLYGSLTKNITTVFGKIKNASLNTLFNTIPGVNESKNEIIIKEEISKIPNIKDATNIYRIFTVEVNGDINGENYVRSFKWVK